MKEETTASREAMIWKVFLFVLFWCVGFLHLCHDKSILNCLWKESSRETEVRLYERRKKIVNQLF